LLATSLRSIYNYQAGKCEKKEVKRSDFFHNVTTIIFWLFIFFLVWATYGFMRIFVIAHNCSAITKSKLRAMNGIKLVGS
jgi:hypothetical protein